MKRHFYFSIIAFGVPTLFLWIILPIRSIQVLLWICAFLFFVIGDSVTTSLVQRYDNLAEVGPATRQICGRSPSRVCASGTRIVFFTVSLLAYLIVIQAGIGVQFEMVTLTAVMLPLVLAVASIIIFLNNSYQILREELTERPRPFS